MQGNRKVGTRPEVALRSELHRRGLRFRKNAPIRTPLRLVRPDIIFTRRRLAVFVDGCFWHRCPQHGTSPRTNSPYWSAKLDRNVARDTATDEALRAAGWSVVHVWEHEPIVQAADVVEGHLADADGSGPATPSGPLSTDPDAGEARTTSSP